MTLLHAMESVYTPDHCMVCKDAYPVTWYIKLQATVMVVHTAHPFSLTGSFPSMISSHPFLFSAVSDCTVYLRDSLHSGREVNSSKNEGQRGLINNSNTVVETGLTHSGRKGEG